MTLERLVAGEEIDAGLGAHVDGCRECSAYVGGLRSAQAAFQRERPPELFLRQLARAARPSRWSERLSWMGLAAAVTLGIAVVVPNLRAASESSHPGVTLKGGVFSAVYLRSGFSGPQPVAEDLRMRKGDAVRFFYQAPERGYLTILDLDGRRKPSVLFPFDGARMEPVEPGRREPLPHSLVLDDAPGPEYFVAVFSRTPLALEPLLQALAEHSSLEQVQLSCSGCEVSVLRVQKER